MLAFFIFTLASILLCVLCLYNSHVAFIQKYKGIFIALAIGVLFTLCALAIYSILMEKTALKKSLLGIYLIILACEILIFILQKTGFFRLVDSSEKLQEYLQKSGAWMPVVYIALQFFQVIILPIPSVVSTIAGVALFGAFWATIYSLIGILLGSISAFFIGRMLGNRAVAWMIGKETLAKWQKKLKGKDMLVLSLMFLLPLFPDDILCFVAGVSTMSTRYFLIVVLFARFIGIFATCYSIDFIPFTTWWGISIWVLFALIIIVSCIFIYKNMDKIQCFFKQFPSRFGKRK